MSKFKGITAPLPTQQANILNDYVGKRLHILHHDTAPSPPPSKNDNHHLKVNRPDDGYRPQSKHVADFILKIKLHFNCTYLHFLLTKNPATPTEI